MDLEDIDFLTVEITEGIQSELERAGLLGIMRNEENADNFGNLLILIIGRILKDYFKPDLEN